MLVIRTLIVSGLLTIPLWAGGAAPSTITVFTEPATLKPIFNVLTFPARIESKVKAIIRSESDGAVRQILKPLGSRIRRGQTVAIIRHTDPVYEFAPLAVNASVSGVVNEVHITNGSLVNKGDPIVTVTDPDQLRVIVEVTALDLNAVRSGLKGELSIPGIQQPLIAEVKGVSPSIDPMLGTATAELQVITKDQKQIVAGMVGRVQFKVNQRQGYMLPDYAIVYRGENAFVRVVTEGRSNKVPVKLGEKRQGEVEVTSGLKPGDVVIKRASRFVADGAEVQLETARE